MDRRTFLYYTGATAVISASAVATYHITQKDKFPKFNGFEELREKLLRQNDKLIPELLEKQERDTDSPNFGGVCDSWYIYSAGATAGLIKSLSCSYSQPSSKYFSDSRIAESLESAARYLLSIQHDDGTIDLLSTNFHSTPDTGFVVENIWNSYQLLKTVPSGPNEVILNLLKDFLIRAGEALATGGIHTPNHRWVVSMALSMLNFEFPDERYSRRIDQWLAEGIDIDPDGQYEEKSTYIYTPLTNRCLMNIARYHNRQDMMDIVDKNLEMMLYYVHPNGEVATEASGRQDQFRIGFMEHYYIPYREAAIRTGNEKFSAMVRLIEDTVPEKLIRYLPYFYLVPELLNPLPSAGSIPDNYLKEFPHSNLVRIRRGGADATILGDNPTFLTMSKGKAVLVSLRLASAFFGKGQFVSPEVKRDGDTLILNWSYKWGYFQPFREGELPNYDLPFGVDRRRREQSEVQDLEASIKISEKEGAFTLEIDIQGTDNVPLAIELAFRKGGKFKGARRLKQGKGVYLYDNEKVIYRYEGDAIEIESAASTHEWTAIRGGLPKPEGDCVYITGFTPYQNTLVLK